MWKKGLNFITRTIHTVLNNSDRIINFFMPMFLRFFFIVVTVSIALISCEKPEDPTTEQLIDQGQSIADIIQQKGADSLLGQAYYSGYIFHVDLSENSALIISKADVSTTANWGCNGASVTLADSAGIGYGAANTAAILQACASPYSAAFACDNYIVETFNDWYLPSESELKKAYDELNLIKPSVFAADYYWTSTQVDGSYARYVACFDGTVGSGVKSDIHRVKAVKKVF